MTSIQHQDALKSFLTGLVEGQRAVKRATARVEWETDPAMPGRRACRITGHSKAIVQHAVDECMRMAEDAPGGGLANFLGPYLIDPANPGAGYIALGEVVVEPAQVPA